MYRSVKLRREMEGAVLAYFVLAVGRTHPVRPRIRGSVRACQAHRLCPQGRARFGECQGG
jgi:hypothetical protein